MYARSPRIDFLTQVEWQERQSLLKAAFPTYIRNRRATYEIQFGNIERPTHRNTSWEEAAFEVPAQRWADLSDTNYGVAVLADCKHGYIVRDRTLWLTLLKGAIDPDPDADRGQHQFTYSLLPHAAGLDVVRRAAYGLTRPLLWRRESAHSGALPPRFSIATVSGSGTLIETVKYAEDDGDALILRLYEADGGVQPTSLQLGVRPEAVYEVDLLERNPRPLSLASDGTLPLELRAREVKTLLTRPLCPRGDHESQTTVPHGEAWRTLELAGADLSRANRTGEQARGGVARLAAPRRTVPAAVRLHLSRDSRGDRVG